MIPYNPVINELEIAEAISGESHLVGIVGTATYVPSTIRLVQVPQGPFPAVTIPGFSEVLSYSGTNQFIVDYTTGVIVFSSDVANGTSVAASYNGLGSEFAAENVNELQAPLSAIATQSIIYNWPSAPTVTYVLNPTTLTSSHIFVGNASNVATDVALSGDATLSNVGALTLSTVNSNVGSFGSSISIPSFTVNAKGLITAASGNVVIAPAGTLSGTSLNSTVVTSSLTSIGTQSQALNMGSHLINNVTDPVSIQDAATKNYVDIHIISPGGSNTQLQYNNSGVFGGASITTDGTSLFVTSAGHTNLGSSAHLTPTASTTQIDFFTNLPGAYTITGDSSDGTLRLQASGVELLKLDGNFSIINVETTLDMLHHQINNLVLQSGTSEPVSPTEGQLFYRTDTHQFEGWNGSSWAILG